ncbi:MAG: type II secretion system protein [Planctomycetes bacterium]|nr:type II secretion system protein [Planctomycetota bacterium]
MTIQRKSKLQRRETRCNSWWMLAIRPSFTLVELLVVMVIIALLAGMTMIALAGAQRDAEISRTRSTIRKINEILLGKWEEFSVRALPIELPAVAMRPTSLASGTVPVSGQEIARLRLVGLRDLMRMEMPDRITDIGFTPTLLQLEVVNNNPPSRAMLPVGNVPYPALWSNYREKFFQPIALPTLTPYSPGPIGTLRPAWTITNANAELLYWVIAASSNNGIGGLEGFHATEIADTDLDGYPEFVDAWQRPIKWIRWPAGADWSEIVAAAKADARILETQGGDAMDVTKADWRFLNDATGVRADNPFTLQPLVLSAGPDGAFDVVFDVTDIDAAATPIVYATQRPTFTILGPFSHGSTANYFYPDPYRAYTVAGNDVYLGQIFDYDASGSHADNVTSHDTLFDQ